MKTLATAVGIIGLSVLANTAVAAPFTNGSFELGNTTSPFTTLGVGSTDLTGWAIEVGTIDYIADYWQPSQGERSLDMSGLGAGGIGQTFDTAIGTTYQVTFDMAGNPDGGPTVKNLKSYITGGSGTIVSVTDPFSTSGTSKAAMGWLTYTYSFVADSTQSTIHFLSLVNTAFGPALDNVTVSAVPIPAALPLFASGLAAFGIFARRRRKAAAALA